MAEGARLESVFALTRNVGSNPTLSAISLNSPEFCLGLETIPRLSRQTNSTASSVAAPKLPFRIGMIATAEPCRGAHRGRVQAADWMAPGSDSHRDRA